MNPSILSAPRSSSIAFLLLAAQAAPSAAADDFARWRNLFAGGALSLEAAPGLEDAARAWASALERRTSLSVAPGGSSSGARVLVGTISSPGSLASLAARLPVTFSREGIRVDRTLLAAPRDFVVLACADPDRPDLPLFAVLGNDLPTLRRVLPSIDLPRLPSVRAYRDGEPWRAWSVEQGGVLAPVGRGPESEPPRWEVVLDAPPFRFFAPEGNATSDCARRLEPAFRGILSFFETLASSRWSGETIEIRLYAHPEDKARQTGSAAPAHANLAIPRLHLLVADESCRGGGRELARLVARRLLGFAEEPWLEDGLAAAAAGDGALAVAVGLQDAAAAPSVAEIRDPRRARTLSPLRTVPIAAALAQTMFTTAGPRAFLRGYTGEVSLPSNEDLERLLQPGIERLRLGFPYERAAEGGPARRFEGGFQRGAFLRSDPDGAATLGSRSADRALERLAAAGAGWVFLSVRVSDPSGHSPPDFVSERDALDGLSEIRWAARRAKSLGLRVGLRPLRTRIAAGMWEWSLIPDSRLGSDEGAARRFDLAVHHALLAREIGADLLVVGTDEFGSARNPRFLADWRRLLASVRTLYSGAVAYAARGDYAGAVPFLDELDFLAVSVFDPYPERIVDLPDPAAALRWKVDGWVELVKGSRTPLLLLEAGFRVPGPGPRGSESGLSRWGRAMRALRDAVADRPEIFGIHWWAWRAESGGDSDANRRDAPRSEDAEDVFRELLAASPR